MTPEEKKGIELEIQFLTGRRIAIDKMLDTLYNFLKGEKE